MVPIGKRATGWILSYLERVRPLHAKERGDGPLFLTTAGDRLAITTIDGLVRRALSNAGIEKGSCHLFRHSCATLMMENGADLPYIQQLLGHESIRSTQIYTHVSITKLKEVHTRTHPAK